MCNTHIIYDKYGIVNMAGKKIYGESKRRFTMTLTETAIQWLEEKQHQLGANSLSDVIERMAREKVDKQ
ncbi:hypothetical protein CYANOKiyG1_02370 [Okeania sp. KiyG1]|nr:hypothetical protein CYANOKiyG1_02370 [Okeania sp. KiyG1]